MMKPLWVAYAEVLSCWRCPVPVWKIKLWSASGHGRIPDTAEVANNKYWNQEVYATNVMAKWAKVKMNYNVSAKWAKRTHEPKVRVMVKPCCICNLKLFEKCVQTKVCVRSMMRPMVDQHQGVIQCICEYLCIALLLGNYNCLSLYYWNVMNCTCVNIENVI